MIGMVTAAIVACAVFFLYGLSIHPLNLILLIIISALFSLLPDIDHKSGTATWLFFGTGLILIILGALGVGLPFIGIAKNVLLLGIIILVCTFGLAQFSPHRGPVHTIWFGALCSLGIFLLTKQWQDSIIAFSAFYSHLVADGIWDKLY